MIHTSTQIPGAPKPKYFPNYPKSDPSQPSHRQRISSAVPGGLREWVAAGEMSWCVLWVRFSRVFSSAPTLLPRTLRLDAILNSTHSVVTHKNNQKNGRPHPPDLQDCASRQGRGPQHPRPPHRRRRQGCRPRRCRPRAAEGTPFLKAGFFLSCDLST